MARLTGWREYSIRRRRDAVSVDGCVKLPRRIGFFEPVSEWLSETLIYRKALYNRCCRSSA